GGRACCPADGDRPRLVTGDGPGPRGRSDPATGRKRRVLGQHFLSDPGVAARIVEAVGATAADVVCEIGAGPGALTRALAARAGRLLALEIDPALRDRPPPGARGGAGGRRGRGRPGGPPARLADGRVYPYEGLPALRPTPEGRVLVVGNLPYSASKAILERLLAAHAALDRAVLMLQREVAERLAARPGGREYGALSVFWQR